MGSNLYWDEALFPDRNLSMSENDFLLLIAQKTQFLRKTFLAGSPIQQLKIPFLTLLGRAKAIPEVISERRYAHGY